MAKIPISVLALFSDDIFFPDYKLPLSNKMLAKHRVIPLKILTPESQTLIIDKITAIERVASMKAGGLGDRYTCLATEQNDDNTIQKLIYVYKDDNEWYLEARF